MIGQMRSRIIIRRWGYIQRLSGGIVEVLTDAWTVWAKVENGGGRMLTDNQQATWQIDFKITFRYEDSRQVYTNDTIDFDGNRYVIKSADILYEGNRRFIECKVSTSGVANTDNLTTMLSTLNYTGLGGEDNFTNSSLIGKTLKGCFKDGIEFKFITSGSLDFTQKQVLFDSTLGKLTWSTPFQLNENAFIQYSDV